MTLVIYVTYDVCIYDIIDYRRDCVFSTPHSTPLNSYSYSYSYFTVILPYITMSSSPQPTASSNMASAAIENVPKRDMSEIPRDETESLQMDKEYPHQVLERVSVSPEKNEKPNRYIRHFSRQFSRRCSRRFI